MNMRARHEDTYFITYIDDYTRYRHIYLISHKFQALDCFRWYMKFVENQLDMSIKALSADCGHEYLFEQFKEFYDEKRIESLNNAWNTQTKWFGGKQKSNTTRNG